MVSFYTNPKKGTIKKRHTRLNVAELLTGGSGLWVATPSTPDYALANRTRVLVYLIASLRNPHEQALALQIAEAHSASTSKCGSKSHFHHQDPFPTDVSLHAVSCSK